jgi:hypothetical protein
MLTVFTALYIVLRFIPYTIMIGGTGGFLSLSDFLAPLYGIILGPYVGGLSVLLGNFAALGFGRPPVFFGFGDFLPDFVAAVSTGLLVRRKWAPVVLLNTALLVAFLLNPLTSVFVIIPGTTISFPFAWMHIVAFAVLISPLGRKATQWVDSAKTKFIGIGLAILTFIGIMMQHLMGNILFEVVLGQLTTTVPAGAYPGIWTTVFFAYPVERSILVVSAVLVGTPLIYIIKKNPFLRLGK